MIWTKTVGYVDDCHVVVGTPDCLAEVLQDPNAQEVLQHTKACSSRLCALQLLLLLGRITLVLCIVPACHWRMTVALTSWTWTWLGYKVVVGCC